MNHEDIQAFARATEHVMREVEASEKVPTIEMLEAIETATRNPVLGFGIVCGLAARVGINYLGLGIDGVIAGVSDVDASDLDEAQQAEYRIAYVRAVNESKRLEEYMPAASVARLLGLTALRVRQMISEGKLNGEKRGGRWFVSKESFDEIVAERGLAEEWLHGKSPEEVGWGDFKLEYGTFRLDLVSPKGEPAAIEVREDADGWRATDPTGSLELNGSAFDEAEDAGLAQRGRAAVARYRVPED